MDAIERVNLHASSLLEVIASEPKKLASLKVWVVGIQRASEPDRQKPYVRGDLIYLAERCDKFLEEWRPSPNPSPGVIWVQPNWASAADHCFQEMAAAIRELPDSDSRMTHPGGSAIPAAVTTKGGTSVKKFQVFISSTFSDLHDVREAVTWELLAGDYIPAGMESFPAANDRGWNIITRVIDNSDYYVLLIAGRYGSIDAATKVSWTEREYDYALSRGIPVFAFIRTDAATTADKMETDPEQQQRLRAFKAKVKGAHLCKDWSTEADLQAKVIQAVNASVKNDPPRPGWLRGSTDP